MRYSAPQKGRDRVMRTILGIPCELTTEQVLVLFLVVWLLLCLAFLRGREK